MPVVSLDALELRPGCYACVGSGFGAVGVEARVRRAAARATGDEPREIHRGFGSGRAGG